ncbi:hypothetical protein [Paenibacillus chungangensis]|uniref:Uncharacterized protein n=1 Tax=Paenibacillus chungangensis TaxID=696535 RepID=A0ABW3HTB1_9BACL
MRRSIVMMIVLLSFMVAILTLPGWKEAARDNTSFDAPLLPAALEKQDEQTGERLSPEKLSFALEEEEDGFGLRFDKEQYVTLLRTVQAGHAIVHMTERSSKSGDSRIYDAIVVRPDTGEAESYPLFETFGDNYTYIGSPQFYPSGNNQVWFIKHTVDNEQLSYSLMRLDVSTGGVSTRVPDFWLVDQRDEAERDDFIIQSYPLYDEHGQLQKLMVTTFQGKMWVLPWEGDYGPAVYDSPATYPAYGDIGSKPPRSLLFPSPDLGRFVYRFVDRNQIMPGNHYEVIDTATRQVVGLIGMEETMIPMDNGIRWNEEGSLFLLEYADREETMGMTGDNAHYLFAQGINVYNRDGELVRSLKAPSAKRMNAYGWVGENHLLIEVYTPKQLQGDGTWWKERVGYQLYDVDSDQLASLTIVPDVREMNEAVQKLWAGAGFGHDSQSFLLLDRSAGQVWEPGVKGYQWHEHANIWNVYMDEGALLYRWDEENRTLEPAYFDQEYALQAVAGDWGVFRHRSADNEGPVIRYILFKQYEEVLTQDELPQLPSSFFYEEPNRWWDSDDRKARKLEEKQLRVKGSSRYGSLQLTALPGEWGSRITHNYYGSYEVSFRDRNGRDTEEGRSPIRTSRESMAGIPLAGDRR